MLKTILTESFSRTILSLIAGNLRFGAVSYRAISFDGVAGISFLRLSAGADWVCFCGAGTGLAFFQINCSLKKKMAKIIKMPVKVRVFTKAS